MRGVFNPSILNHRARDCRAALLPAWMQAPTGVRIGCPLAAQKAVPEAAYKPRTNHIEATQKARG